VERHADVVVVGGGTGGVAAALAAASTGSSVILAEESDWIGGQLTAQAVPPDEHPWIERFGCTRTYREFRDGVRDRYRRHFPLTARARRLRWLNPGNGWVSGLCLEPRVALAVLEEMLAPHIRDGRATVLTRHQLESAETAGDRITAVGVRDLETGERVTLTALYFLDATETGGLLPLAGVEYVTGAESAEETGEPHALDGPADPLDIQSVTVCFAMDHRRGEDHTIEAPVGYRFWREYGAEFWPGRQLSWVTPDPKTLVPVENTLFPVDDRPSLWTYRRIADRANFQPGAYPSDITLVNWPQNDYWLGPIYEVGEAEARRNLEAARELSLSLLYWLQTEAPRADGGQGYPGLRLRPDVVGTADGLAKSPYIRESRRIRAEFTVLEQHVGVEAREARGPERFADSVGVGAYRIDLHPSTGGRSYIDIAAWPFQIPLGALIPVRVQNLLPACKNIGTTHVTNGCYRLHPVEWNIGEAAGYLAAHCVAEKLVPRQVRGEGSRLQAFQALLTRMGVELAWPRRGIRPL
jgi:hypothetical protein